MRRIRLVLALRLLLGSRAAEAQRPEPLHELAADGAVGTKTQEFVRIDTAPLSAGRMCARA